MQNTNIDIKETEETITIWRGQEVIAVLTVKEGIISLQSRIAR